MYKVGLDAFSKNPILGQGFYLYNSKSEAESWAKIASNRKGDDFKPIVNVYNFDYFRTKNIGYRFNEFETYNIEWLNFVVDCHKGKDVFSDYDIVIAGSIDDEIANIVEDYEKGVITAEQALEQLRYKGQKLSRIFAKKLICV